MAADTSSSRQRQQCTSPVSSALCVRSLSTTPTAAPRLLKSRPAKQTCRSRLFAPIVEVQVKGNDVLLFLGEPLSALPPEDHINARQLLEKLEALPAECAEYSVEATEGTTKIDDRVSIRFDAPIHSTGRAEVRPEGNEEAVGVFILFHRRAPQAPTRRPWWQFWGPS
jgi:hypothetical protein